MLVVIRFCRRVAEYWLEIVIATVVITGVIRCVADDVIEIAHHAQGESP